jgi:hypothetical protein
MITGLGPPSTAAANAIVPVALTPATAEVREASRRPAAVAQLRDDAWPAVSTAKIAAATGAA